MAKKKLISLCVLILPMFLILGLAIWLNIYTKWIIVPLASTGSFLHLRYFSQLYTNPSTKDEAKNSWEHMTFITFVGYIYFLFIGVFAVGIIIEKSIPFNSLIFMLFMIPIYTFVCSLVSNDLTNTSSSEIVKTPVE